MLTAKVQVRENCPLIWCYSVLKGTSAVNHIGISFNPKEVWFFQISINSALLISHPFIMNSYSCIQI